MELDRTRTRVRVQEVGAGSPVVFVHGASTAGTSWASLAARLDDFRCILIDRPGCGLSPTGTDGFADMSRLGAFADDLVVDVLDSLEVEVASVVGTSFGGYFALRAAAAHPGRITRLVLLGWSFGARVESTPLVMRIATRPLLGRLLTRIPPTDLMVRSMLRQVGLRRAIENGRFGDVELAWFRSLFRDTDTMRNEIDASPPIMTMRGFNADTLLPVELLNRVVAPTLLLWGDEDPMGGTAVADSFACLLADSTLEVMSRTGHAPWVDDPDHVAARLRDFLNP